MPTSTDLDKQEEPTPEHEVLLGFLLESVKHALEGAYALGIARGRLLGVQLASEEFKKVSLTKE